MLKPPRNATAAQRNGRRARADGAAVELDPRPCGRARRGRSGRGRRARSRRGRVRVARDDRGRAARDHGRREPARAAPRRARATPRRGRLVRDAVDPRHGLDAGRRLPRGRTADRRRRSDARSRHASALARRASARLPLVRAGRARSRLARRHARPRHAFAARTGAHRGVGRRRLVRLAAHAHRRRARRSGRRAHRDGVQRVALGRRFLVPRSARDDPGRPRRLRDARELGARGGERARVDRDPGAHDQRHRRAHDHDARADPPAGAPRDHHERRRRSSASIRTGCVAALELTLPAGDRRVRRSRMGTPRGPHDQRRRARARRRRSARRRPPTRSSPRAAASAGAGDRPRRRRSRRASTAAPSASRPGRGSARRSRPVRGEPTRASASTRRCALRRRSRSRRARAATRGSTRRTSADPDSTSELRPTGNVGAELDVGPVTLATHGGVLARPPSFVERFGNRGAFIGDPLLRPESATTIDAGATLHEEARARCASTPRPPRSRRSPTTSSCS